MADEIERLAEVIVATRKELGFRLAQVQGFLYGKDHVVRDCYLPGPEQEVWRRPASEDTDDGMDRFIREYQTKIVTRAALSAAGLEVNKAGELARKDRAMNRQASAVRTLRHHEGNELNQLRTERTQAYLAIGSLDSEREMNARLTEELERLVEALTPSSETKAAYMSEVYCDHCDEDEAPHFVPWGSIKAIMSMIQKRAARTAATLTEGE